MLGKAAGSTFINLPGNELNSFPIPLPPLSEQKRIAALLNEQMAAVERARKAAEECLAAVNELPAAYLRAVFPAPDQPLPDGWRWVKLGEVCEIVSGTTPKSGTPEYWNGEIVWITPTDLGKLRHRYITDSERRISKAGFDSCNLTMLPVGSVVLSSRAPIGHLGIVTVPLCTNQGCKTFVPGDALESEFLYHAMKRSVWDLQQMGSGATFAEVSKTQLEGFEIPLPPLSEQKRIAALLNEQMAAVERARKAAEEELEAINRLPAALLRRAFAGEL